MSLFLGGTNSIGNTYNPPSGELYDLSAHDIQFTHTWPTQPDVSSGTTVTVTSLSELQTQAALGNRTITVDFSGETNNTAVGNVTINGTDIIINMPNDHHITGVVSIGSGSGGTASQRIRWNGGNITAGLLQVNWCRDLTLYDMVIEVDCDGDPAIGNVIAGNHPTLDDEVTRFASINCTWRAINGEEGNGFRDSYSIYYPQYEGHNDHTFCNCKFVSASSITTGSSMAHTLRFQTLTRAVFVDCAINPPNPEGNVSSTGFRLHHLCEDVYMGDCFMIGRFKADQAGGEDYGVINYKGVNITRIFDENAQFVTDLNTANTGTVENCTQYYISSGTFNSGDFTDLGGNTFVGTWNGTTYEQPDSNAFTPNYDNYGAVRA